MKIGDVVRTKDFHKTGRISYVYDRDFVDVVWDCEEKNFHRFASSKELKNDLIFLGKSIRVLDKPVLVQSCKHGKVFQVSALISSNLSFDVIFQDTNPHDRISVVGLNENPQIERCNECGF